VASYVVAEPEPVAEAQQPAPVAEIDAIPDVTVSVASYVVAEPEPVAEAQQAAPVAEIHALSEFAVDAAVASEAVSEPHPVAEVVTAVPVAQVDTTSTGSLTPSVAPDTLETFAADARVRRRPFVVPPTWNTPPLRLDVDTPEVAAGAPPVVAEQPPMVEVPVAFDAPVDATAPTVVAAAPPVESEPPPLAAQPPMQRIFRAMQRYRQTVSVPPEDVSTHEEAAAAPSMVSEQPSAVSTIATAAPPPDVHSYDVAAAAPPPAVSERSHTAQAQLDKVAAVAASIVSEQPSEEQVPAASAAPPLKVRAYEVSATASPVIAEQPPAAQAEMAAFAPSHAATTEPPAVEPTPVAATEEPIAARRTVPPPPRMVLPISRSPIRPEAPPPIVSDPTLSGLERLLRVSAARGASTLYLSSGSRPSVRVDGELQSLDGEPVHVARDVESLLLTLMPERSHEALRTGGATEWIVDIDGVGRVRCMSFRDHFGPGGVFRLMPTRSFSADQLGLPRQVQSLAIEPEGLVLVAGSRSSGKRTLMAAFVDLMNRSRRDHIITLEREINMVHVRGQSFISQREVRGNDDEMLAAARAALREDPDVIVIEDLRTGPLMNVALEAAASGRLVVGGFSAHTATGAIDRIIDLYAPEHRRQVQFALADSLRGVIVQTLLRKIGGGRLPAREVLLNTPAVSGAIAEGKTSQLPMAIEGGRRYGMMPLNDTLVGLVQNGSVEAREAYRHSPDRPGFLAALNRHGLDTSFVERLA
jgi:twitching motility protein PilT